MVGSRLGIPVVFAIAMLPFGTVAQDHGHGDTARPYASFDQRKIKSLSEQDIEQLRRGSGWGLALPAELNGLPGPLHLLELGDELELSAGQKQAITEIYDAMRADAIAAGERFIAAEAALSDAFTVAGLSEETLRDLLAEAANARGALRFIHLSRHLATPPLLSEEQIRRYTVLRGYSDDPCAKVPTGHIEWMWRLHNGCD